MTTKGRPRVPGESVYVRLDPKIAEELAAYMEDFMLDAQQKGSPAKISKNAVINYALKKFLDGKGETLMTNVWTTELVTIKEKAFDYDLHCFAIYKLSGGYLGTIYPDSIETMNDMIEMFELGCCPIEEGWEDGNGASCTMAGWGIMN